jgi:Cys-rich protein (TIGR01571 family)
MATPQSYPPIQQQPAAQPAPSQTNQLRIWSTPLFDCLRDEETCWWSFWCCWIISARNTEEFDIGSAKNQIIWCLSVFFVSFLIFFIGLGPLGIFLIVLGSIFYVFYRSNNRKLIKEKLHIQQGNPVSDCLIHCCCGFCGLDLIM